MAVVDKYTDAVTQAGGRANALTSLASQASIGVAGVSIAAGDDDGSKYRIFNNVPVSMTLSQVLLMVTTGITAATDYDLGVYKVAADGGAVLDKDLFMDGQTLATAGILNGLSNVANANANMSIADLYFTANAANIGVSEVDIVLTANTVGTADGTLRVVALGAHA